MIQNIQKNSLQCPNCGKRLSCISRIRDEEYGLDEVSCPYCGCPLDN